MKTKITTYALLLLITIVSSCKKEEANPAENFIGIFKGTSTCNAGAQITANVSKSSKGKDAIIIMLGTDDLDATVSGNSITMNNQTVSGVTVSGSGNMNGNALTINMNLSANGQSVACTFSGTKQ